MIATSLTVAITVFFPRHETWVLSCQAEIMLCIALSSFVLLLSRMAKNKPIAYTFTTFSNTAYNWFVQLPSWEYYIQGRSFVLNKNYLLKKAYSSITFYLIIIYFHGRWFISYAALYVRRLSLTTVYYTIISAPRGPPHSVDWQLPWTIANWWRLAQAPLSWK